MAPYRSSILLQSLYCVVFISQVVSPALAFYPQTILVAAPESLLLSLRFDGNVKRLGRTQCGVYVTPSSCSHVDAWSTDRHSTEKCTCYSTLDFSCSHVGRTTHIRKRVIATRQLRLAAGFFWLSSYLRRLSISICPSSRCDMHVSAFLITALRIPPNRVDIHERLEASCCQLFTSPQI